MKYSRFGPAAVTMALIFSRKIWNQGHDFPGNRQFFLAAIFRFATIRYNA
jgi:hypothetical protein